MPTSPEVGGALDTYASTDTLCESHEEQEHQSSVINVSPQNTKSL